MSSDVVTDRLRTALLAGQYAPRQRLIETELAADLSVSRSAVRNALLQLAAEGLVEMQLNRGARVREISLAEAVEITEVRQGIESLVAARAAERVTDEQAEELRELGERMSDAVVRGELVAYSDLNAALHARLREIAGHETATRIVEQLNGQLVRHQFRLAMLPGRPGRSLPEHLAIIDAVRARDAEGARAAMAAHLGSVLTTLAALEDGSGRRA
ncbi:GntR family transcriptional regulator [Antribacter gilvus]|uniref:GntR family transcriptional regulator n=1 Tax=Antribacter gilvus TaxID=2304675 RepID=UPI000F78B5BC|nr:GntR family transcriptional regulator [Antribacter gilvus]